MKKELVFLVLAIFLISAVSFAIAENESHRNNNSEEREDKNDSSNENDTLTAIRERERERENENESENENAEGGMRAAVAGFGGLKSFIVQRFMENHPVIVQKFLEQLNNTNKSEILKHLDRARLEKCLNNTEECKERIKEWTLNKVKVKDIIRVREIAKDKLLEANNKFLRAKNKYLEMKNIRLRVRDEFLGLKDQLKDCRKSNEDCSALENQTFEKAQEDLITIADRLIQYLEKVKSKVESAENLNSTEAQEAIAKIDNLTAKLEDAKDELEAATEQDDLKEGAQMIREVWKDMKYSAFRYAERVIYSEVGQIFSRSELLEKKLEIVIGRLNDNGVNTTEMEELLDDFSAKIDDAREKMKDANDLFSEAKDLRAENKTEEAKEKLEEAKNLTREAHQDLKDAHKILMDLVRMINQKGESFDPDEINEEDEVEVVEEEED